MRDDRRNKQPQQVLFSDFDVSLRGKPLPQRKKHMMGAAICPTAWKNSAAGAYPPKKTDGGMVQHHGEDRNEL